MTTAGWISLVLATGWGAFLFGLFVGLCREDVSSEFKTERVYGPSGNLLNAGIPVISWDDLMQGVEIPEQLPDDWTDE